MNAQCTCDYFKGTNGPLNDDMCKVTEPHNIVELKKRIYQLKLSFKLVRINIII